MNRKRKNKIHNKEQWIPAKRMCVCVCQERPQPILVNIIQCRSEPPDTPLQHHIALSIAVQVQIYKCVYVCMSQPYLSMRVRIWTRPNIQIFGYTYVCVCVCRTSCINILFSSLALSSCQVKPRTGIHLSVNNWNIINNIEPVQQAGNVRKTFISTKYISICVYINVFTSILQIVD